MKMIKAMKKLKFWSRKKRQKKYLLLAESPPPPSRPPPPPPPYYMLHCPYEPLLPSAPPIPPWLEYDRQFEEMPSTSEINPADSAVSDSSTSISHLSAVPEITDPPQVQPNASHQQCMVPNPVHETPLVPQLKKLERSGGSFGCILGFGVHLVRCVFLARICLCQNELVSANSAALHTAFWQCL